MFFVFFFSKKLYFFQISVTFFDILLLFLIFSLGGTKRSSPNLGFYFKPGQALGKEPQNCQFPQ